MKFIFCLFFVLKVTKKIKQMTHDVTEWYNLVAA